MHLGSTGLNRRELDEAKSCGVAQTRLPANTLGALHMHAWKRWLALQL